MARSFQIVIDKIAETEFFLCKIKEAGLNFAATRYYFSAFLSAARSITFTLQCSLKDVSDFDKWYALKQDLLKKDAVARFILEARNESQKEGIYHITSGLFKLSQNGEDIIKYYFDQLSFVNKGNSMCAPAEDVVTATNKFFVLLLQIIFDCFQEFGRIMDPSQYYTLENLQRMGKSVEDVEEEFGYPRGWTNCIPNEKRLEVLKKQIPDDIEIDRIFIKYLGKDKLGNTTI